MFSSFFKQDAYITNLRLNKLVSGMDIAYRYIGNPSKKHSMPVDEFLDVLFAVGAGMDTVRKISLRTKRGMAITAQLVMLLTRQGFLVRKRGERSPTFKITQRAHVLMQKAIEVEKDLGVIGENRWGIEILL